MSLNPYDSPGGFSHVNRDEARNLINGPAIGLMVTSILFVVVLVIGMVFNIFLLASGVAGELDQPEIGISKETQIVVRMIFGLILMGINAGIFIGALKMKQLTSYSWAYAAAVMSVVPCCGPCYILGIPFGVWALIVLNKDEVKGAFR